MKSKILLLSLFVLIGYTKTVKSQSYEGYISDNLPVWMDLNPTNNGTITGNYFYKKNGISIALSGTSKGTNLILSEKNKSGEISGIFTCTTYQDSIVGDWKKPNTTKGLSVKLYKTKPSFKLYAKIPTTDKLILAKGNSLADAMNEMAGEVGKAPKLNYTFDEKGILSTNFTWESTGAYTSSGTVYHTFDLTNSNSEIFLSVEINPDKLSNLSAKLKAELQKQLKNHKLAYSEQEWVDAFGDKETFEKAFSLTEIPTTLLDNYFFKRGYVQIVIEHYFEFPHAAEAMDFNSNIKIPFSEFSLYLKDNSVLRNLK